MSDDLTYPPSEAQFTQDLQENVRKAEQAAAALERQVDEHLQSTYHVWEQLSPQRKSELWGLELARGVGRRQKDVGKLKETNRLLKQERTNLKTQIEQLNRLQQPREFRIMPPATIPIEEYLSTYWLDLAAKGHQGVGLGVDDRGHRFIKSQWHDDAEGARPDNPYSHTYQRHGYPNPSSSNGDFDNDDDVNGDDSYRVYR
ncbi:hypothetical protein UCREL1_9448 [Eutypa lata UCREL1]|uniref:Uncharacterized protein n=1 Tax=Eutypa lata (strain UCR-EL1) TaxID=1287681 RepID=M7SHH4_EUTLA|nr:hypothetical protein UCREL1_9448 [Eutypa lata UCREL1]